jgi:hypothetical protein
MDELAGNAALVPGRSGHVRRPEGLKFALAALTISGSVCALHGDDNREKYGHEKSGD